MRFCYQETTELCERRYWTVFQPSTIAINKPIVTQPRLPSKSINSWTRSLKIFPNITYKVTHSTSPSTSQTRKRRHGYRAIRSSHSTTAPATSLAID